jgi:mono/diheme cytochrome c family protein
MIEGATPLMRNSLVGLMFFSVVPAIVGFGLGEAKADARRGRVLAEQWCSQCHAVAPNEATGDPAAPDFPDIAQESSATAYALRVFLRTPHATMPNFILARDDIEDIISYILSLRRRR